MELYLYQKTGDAREPDLISLIVQMVPACWKVSTNILQLEKLFSFSPVESPLILFGNRQQMSVWRNILRQQQGCSV